MSTWTIYITNETADALRLSSTTLDCGHWHDGTPPPETIAAGSDATLVCATGAAGKIAGSATYVAQRGSCTFTWDVPLFGPPASHASTAGFVNVREGKPAADAGSTSGAMYFLGAEPQTVVAPVAPRSLGAGGGGNTITIPTTRAGCYTEDPRELPVVRTPTTVPQIISGLLEHWPALTGVGARVLTYQWATETARGQHCYDWNFGNVKAFSKRGEWTKPMGQAAIGELHMYLHGTTERMTLPEVQGEIARGKGLAHVATDLEIHGGIDSLGRKVTPRSWWGPALNKKGEPTVVVVYDPPHPTARFHASTSFSAGLDWWLGWHKSHSRSVSAYLPAINRGDLAMFAHLLRQNHYYTDLEERYLGGLQRQQAFVDGLAGAA